MMFNYITWNVTPTAFHIFGLEVRWYGVMFAGAFAIAFLLCGRMLTKEGRTQNVADTLLLYLGIATIVGARLGHCLFYEPSYYLQHPIEILRIRDGGLASHGGAIAVAIALWLAARKHQETFWYLTDRIVILIALVGSFIRMGNLFNSEIYGGTTTLPWGFIFELNDEILPKHPTQIYEALSYLVLFFVLYWYYLHKQRKPKQGQIFGWFLIGLFGMRFLIEFVKSVQEPWEVHYMLKMGQILSIPFILAGIVILLLVHQNKLPWTQHK
ncbi:prolipoprotein diacylglyceryl transferase [Bacteroidia bacterium]|nr:prolipoprotein diacylglyceryl transferase [Bacteroidia bacterium]